MHARFTSPMCDVRSVVVDDDYDDDDLYEMFDSNRLVTKSHSDSKS